MTRRHATIARMTKSAKLQPNPELSVELVGVCRSFDDQPAVDGLDLAIRPGELYGLVGPDGAGKTTAIRLLTGLLDADAGTGWVCGYTIAKPARELIGYMPQHYALYGDLSIEENLDFFGNLFGLPRKLRNQRKERLLQITRLSRFVGRRASALSGGMYKKLALACALLHQPRVLVLDEPTNGVDPVSRRELWDLLYEFVGEGMAVILASPYMDEASRCHRVGLLHRGRLLTEGDPETLAKSFAHPTFLVHMRGRDQVEDLVQARPGVLAISPDGTNLRVVVESGEAIGFCNWVGSHSFAECIEQVAPTFEDVFLGLVADRQEAA